MFPHFKSDVKGFSSSSACAINFKVLYYGKNVCVPVVSLGTPLSGEPRKHFLYSGIHLEILNYLVIKYNKNTKIKTKKQKIDKNP